MIIEINERKCNDALDVIEALKGSIRINDSGYFLTEVDDYLKVKGLNEVPDTTFGIYYANDNVVLIFTANNLKEAMGRVKNAK